MVLIVLNIVNGAVSRTVWPFIAAGLIMICMGFGLHASLRGKFVVWAELLDQLNLRGDERILDIGCGRGTVLLMAAQHLTTGRAVGVDLWRRGDQSGNAAEAAFRNAAAEGVTERVELYTADMAALPFDENSFDIVVSNVAIHNVKGRIGRGKVIGHAVRVLRPGGRLIIADIRATGEYLEELQKRGMNDVGCRDLGWRMWWTGPWLATGLVQAIKPKGAVVDANRQAVSPSRNIDAEATEQDINRHCPRTESYPRCWPSRETGNFGKETQRPPRKE
jgi:ubiquinone/menaquinone biosynthesis C-methylase UbiE